MHEPPRNGADGHRPARPGSRISYDRREASWLNAERSGGLGRIAVTFSRGSAAAGGRIKTPMNRVAVIAGSSGEADLR